MSDYLAAAIALTSILISSASIYYTRRIKQERERAERYRNGDWS